MKNLLLLKGGDSQEREISMITADYLKSLVNKDKFRVFEVEVAKGFKWFCEGEEVELSFDKELRWSSGKKVKMDLCAPCFHGYPGETGHIQAFFEMIQLPFLGCGHEASVICFNKILTKLWLEKINIPVTPFVIAKDLEAESLSKVEAFFDEHQEVFVKASNQGSSVGCYPVSEKKDLSFKLKEAFNYSSFVLVEKLLRPRELEISVFERDGKVEATWPCEIICPGNFYSYEEKYSEESRAQTVITASIAEAQAKQIKDHALAAFENLKLSQFCRMDFFLDQDEIYLNEINTFPGMTPISMFPKMIEKAGYSYQDLINSQLESLAP